MLSGLTKKRFHQPNFWVERPRLECLSPMRQEPHTGV